MRIMNFCIGPADSLHPLILMTLVVVLPVLCNHADAIFFTDSKENDYPRLGRRSDDGVRSDFQTISQSGFPRAISEYGAGVEHQRIRQLFKFLDFDGDGFLSKKEIDQFLQNHSAAWKSPLGK